MAPTITAKGTAAAKTSGTGLTVPDVSMIGGDSLRACVAWDSDVAGNPEIKFGSNVIENFVVGETLTGTGWRMRLYSDIINNTRQKDVVATWPASTGARILIVSSEHQAGAYIYTDSNENLAAGISTAGAFEPIDHISSLVHAFHMSNGPVGDAIGSSTTGMTLGQRIGTSGDADTTNVTVQEAYKIIAAGTTAAGSLVIGDSYQIKTLGTTDFTAVGAASNALGVQFVATGIGSGTGDAYHLEDARSRLTGLATRDHAGIIAFFRPKQTFTVKEMVQHHRLMNHNPDWVEVKIEDESGSGFWFVIDPDHFDDWSDALVSEYASKIASIWLTNNIDSNLVYAADSARDIRMATFVDDQLVL